MGTEISVSVSVLAITSVTALLVLLLVRAIAGRIAKPVNTMVHVAQNIVSGAAEKDLAKNLGATHMKSLESYAMTQGLKKDSNRAKARIVQPKNAYYVREEHPLISALHEVDERYWGGEGGGAAPIPDFAIAIAEATPVVATDTTGDGVPVAALASVSPM